MKLSDQKVPYWLTVLIKRAILKPYLFFLPSIASSAWHMHPLSPLVQYSCCSDFPLHSFPGLHAAKALPALQPPPPPLQPICPVFLFLCSQCCCPGSQLQPAFTSLQAYTLVHLSAQSCPAACMLHQHTSLVGPSKGLDVGDGNTLFPVPWSQTTYSHMNKKAEDKCRCCLGWIKAAVATMPWCAFISAFERVPWKHVKNLLLSQFLEELVF